MARAPARPAESTAHKTGEGVQFPAPLDSLEDSGGDKREGAGSGGGGRYVRERRRGAFAGMTRRPKRLTSGQLGFPGTPHLHEVVEGLVEGK